MQGNPSQKGHSEEFWQNMVHWRRKWQPTPVFFHAECHEEYEKAKWLNDLSLFPSQALKITVIQVYVSTNDAKEAEVDLFSEDLQQLLETTPKIDMLFIIGDWNAKVGSQEILKNNKQVWAWLQNEAKANSFVKKTHCLEKTNFSNNPRDSSKHGYP